MDYIILIIAALITSSISAILGMGGGIILLAIMAIIIPQGFMVIALHGIIQLASNVTRSYVFRKHLKIQLIKEFSAGSIFGLFLSSLIILLLINFFNVSSANEIKIDYLKPIIGLFILWYLYLRKTKKHKKNTKFYFVGGISGISSVFIGATGPLIAPFFLNKDFKKENIIANKAICQAITHLGKIPLFIYFFKLNYITEIKIILPMIIAVFIGTNFGKKIIGYIPENIFIFLFKITLTLISIRLIFSY
tara:strand:+ start:552 stop:1298 length:747 start_codon:yes stop_codon:yes gene_type:complete